MIASETKVIRTNLKIKRDILEKVTLKILNYFGHVARMHHACQRGRNTQEKIADEHGE
jgi:hypothetical protein